jgi:Flp pilus assembly protein TadD
MARYPDEPDLFLNFGQFLLELRRFAEAEDVLEIVLEIDPNNALAHLGLGIAILQQADDDSTVARALPHFQAAARLAPDDPVMKENRIICQNRLSTIGAP